MFMLLDDVLETLICYNCKNYLSVKPVKVYPNRHIQCGRCSTDHDDGIVSIYDTLAELGFFQCINRYEGCDKVLRYAEVPQHEMTCTSNKYKCFCGTVVTGLLAFIAHFQGNHKNSILKTPSFEVVKCWEEF